MIRQQVINGDSVFGSVSLHFFPNRRDGFIEWRRDRSTQASF
jgi:hypothetical protein